MAINYYETILSYELGSLVNCLHATSPSKQSRLQARGHEGVPQQYYGSIRQSGAGKVCWDFFLHHMKWSSFGETEGIGWWSKYCPVINQEFIIITRNDGHDKEVNKQIIVVTFKAHEL